MKICIKKNDNSLKIQRINKLLKLNDKDSTMNVCYDWMLFIENDDDDDFLNSPLKHLHLFCISITKDLLKNRFKTNEQGKILYDFDIDDIDDIDKDYNILNKLSNNILKTMK